MVGLDQSDPGFMCSYEARRADMRPDVGSVDSKMFCHQYESIVWQESESDQIVRTEMAVERNSPSKMDLYVFVSFIFRLKDLRVNIYYLCFAWCFIGVFVAEVRRQPT